MLGRGLLYDTAVGQADDQVERLVGALRSRGEWQRTTLILVSDHSMDTTLLKLNAVTGGWRKIRTRTVTGDRRLARPTSADVAATVMRLFGLRPPGDNAGRALRAAFRPGVLRR